MSDEWVGIPPDWEKIRDRVQEVSKMYIQLSPKALGHPAVKLKASNPRV